MAERAGLGGATVLAFESRMADELAGLLRRHGADPVVVPSVRELPLEQDPAALELVRRLEAGEVDVTILLTGVGVRTLAASVAAVCAPERLASLLRATTLVARGPKPVAALRELGLTADVLAPEPNTWRELLAALDEASPVRGRRVAVQEYGRRNDELVAGLEERGALVLRVPVYRWALPEDTGPLEEAVRRLAAADGGVDYLLFTSATQVDHVLEIAARLGLADAVRAAGDRVVVASIGPICSDALREHGLPVDLEPEHPKMGSLVVALARRGRPLQERKAG